MATTTRISLYNGALRLLGERKLGSLTENREPRRILDDIWDDNVVIRALESGDWLFATRSMMYDYSPSVEPEFGFSRAFNKPDDFVRTSSVCSDEFFRYPMKASEYADEAGFWFAELDTIYVKYISNHSTYGMDMARWPQSFVKYLEAMIAEEACMPLKLNRQAWIDLMKLRESLLAQARSNNAMADGAKSLPKGAWARARSAIWGNRDNE